MDLSIKGLNKKFSKSDEQEFSLDIDEIKFSKDSIVFLMGHNGSGKSVLLKLISNELKPTRGRVIFSESHINVGILRQNPEENLAGELTAGENLLLRFNRKRWIENVFPHREHSGKVNKILKSHKTLGFKKNQIVSELSGGQKQALAFYSVSYGNYDLLCLDEFLSATDENTRKALISELKLLRKSKIILVVSHDKNLALEIAETIIILNNGKVINQLYRSDKSRWNSDFLGNQLLN